jgi:selenocysteine lyase/cysteine desulfurase
MLARYGVEVSYFDPLIGAAIESLFKPNTKAVLVEAPGSQSFEMTDIPAIAEIAHAKGALVIDDNTWATPLFHRSLDQGVDISMQAATKYIGGHSDIMFGTISANAKAWPLLCSVSAPVPTTSSWRCAAPARFRYGSHSITARASKWRAGSPPAPKSCRSCIRHLKATRATRSGSATSPARPACSVLL